VYSPNRMSKVQKDRQQNLRNAKDGYLLYSLNLKRKIELYHQHLTAPANPLYLPGRLLGKDEQISQRLRKVKKLSGKEQGMTGLDQPMAEAEHIRTTITDTALTEEDVRGYFFTSEIM
jgi:hypothetical protein